MNAENRSHSVASVVALLVVPAVMMLLTAAGGGALGKDPTRFVVVVFAVGVMWHGLARRWLQKFAPAADHRLLRCCLLTLFVCLPFTHLVVYGPPCVMGVTEISWTQPVVASLLGVLPLWLFYIGELRN